MSKPKLIAIAAMAENRVIGKEGTLPWHLPEDLKFFKRTTLGGSILFGRTTYEGIGRPLPGRTNYVLSRDWQGDGSDIKLLRSQDDIFKIKDSPLYVCGGAKIYKMLFPHCEELLLTRVLREVEGDTRLPEFEHLFQFQETLEAGAEYRIERFSLIG